MVALMIEAGTEKRQVEDRREKSQIGIKFNEEMRKEGDAKREW